MIVHTGSTSPQQREQAAAAAPLSLPRLHALRVGYLVLGVGLAMIKVPDFLHHEPWTFTEGVMNCMLAALSIVALLGLRYPVQMLPVMLFEMAWKLIWLGVVALPLALSGQMDSVTLNNVYACVWVLIIIAVTPWRYVYTQYVVKRADRWR